MSNDFIVIGAGALGLSTAEALLRTGAAVTVLERGDVGREASWAGGGILSPLCPWDYAEEVTRLALRSMALFEPWAQRLHDATGIDPEYDRCGMLVLPPFDAVTARQWCAAHGVVCLPSPDGITSDLPACGLSRLASSSTRGTEGEGEALSLPAVAQVRNPRLLQAMRAQVLRLGGRIVEQCGVERIVADGGRVTGLQTMRGIFSAEGCVVTAGAWSKVLLGEHALHTDIRPMRGQMLLFKFDTPPLPHILLQGDLYFIPRRDGHLLVGSTVEDVGFDKSTTAAAREMLLQRAVALLPALRDMSIVKHWAGLRPGSPANIPTIGRHPALSNLYINSGHFRYGITMAPASAQILLNEIEGRPQPFDVAPYRWR
ncbi:MAG: glycine oxidase ThiO [Sideroxyarcus sp.]|nr:glycine oxidase ThiO [Sideroxyarcus sp.]